MPTKLTTANETIRTLTAELEEANAARTTLEERVQDLLTQRSALEMRGNATEATSEGLRVALDEAEGRAEQRRQQLEDAQMTINRLSGELETAKSRTESAYRARDREHKRAAATNKRNGELQKALRQSQWDKRTLQLQIDGDVHHIRRLRVLHQQLDLLRDVANTPTDDWIARSADVPVEQLLTRGH
jgi:chromosome segregation ATPase